MSITVKAASLRFPSYMTAGDVPWSVVLTRDTTPLGPTFTPEGYVDFLAGLAPAERQAVITETIKFHAEEGDHASTAYRRNRWLWATGPNDFYVRAADGRCLLDGLAVA